LSDDERFEPRQTKTSEKKSSFSMFVLCFLTLIAICCCVAGYVTYPMFGGPFGLRLFVQDVSVNPASSREAFQNDLKFLRSELFQMQNRRTW
jgi:hypothetical protein